MFTLAQIKAAHSKVRSGADFPTYIKEIEQLGVTFYETYVADGHTDYYGNEDHKATSPAKYGILIIADQSNIGDFAKDLKAHQEGKTDYLTFCGQSAAHGVEKWSVSMENKSCTYYDKVGNKLLVEHIPR